MTITETDVLIIGAGQAGLAELGGDAVTGDGPARAARGARRGEQEARPLLLGQTEVNLRLGCGLAIP